MKEKLSLLLTSRNRFKGELRVTEERGEDV